MGVCYFIQQTPAFSLQNTLALSHLASGCERFTEQEKCKKKKKKIPHSLCLGSYPPAPQPIRPDHSTSSRSSLTQIQCGSYNYISFLIALCCQLITCNLGGSILPVRQIAPNHRHVCSIQRWGSLFLIWPFKCFTSQEKCPGKLNFPNEICVSNMTCLPGHKIIFTRVGYSMEIRVSFFQG